MRPRRRPRRRYVLREELPNLRALHRGPRNDELARGETGRDGVVPRVVAWSSRRSGDGTTGEEVRRRDIRGRDLAAFRRRDNIRRRRSERGGPHRRAGAEETAEETRFLLAGPGMRRRLGFSDIRRPARLLKRELSRRNGSLGLVILLPLVRVADILIRHVLLRRRVVDVRCLRVRLVRRVRLLRIRRVEFSECVLSRRDGVRLSRWRGLAVPYWPRSHAR